MRDHTLMRLPSTPPGHELTTSDQKQETAELLAEPKGHSLILQGSKPLTVMSSRPLTRSGPRTMKGLRQLVSRGTSRSK